MTTPLELTAKIAVRLDGLWRIWQRHIFHQSVSL
jgi:hypothetical protein